MISRHLISSAVALAMAGFSASSYAQTPAGSPRDDAFYASRGISFHASFEESVNAEFSNGRRDAVNPHIAPLYPQQGIAFTEGRVGRGAGAKEITLTYDPSKIFFADRGGVSFWFKPVKGVHRAIFRVSAEEWGVGPNSRLQQELYTDTFLFGPAPLIREGFFRALIRPALDPIDATFNLGELDPERWHHFLWTWDNTQGMRGWLDGKPVFDNWGTTTWIQMMTPRLILISSISAVDELFFFNRPLSSADARTLAAGRLPDPPPPEEPYSIPAALRDHVAHSYGLDELPAYPVVEPGVPVTFTPVDFEKASDGKRPMLNCLDGNRVSSWPDSHIETVNTDYLDIHYPREVEANYFRVISDGRRLALSKDGEAEPFWVDEVRPERDSWEDKLVRRHFTGEPVRFRQLRLDRKGSRVGEFYVYRIAQRPLAIPGANARSFDFDRVVDIRSLPWEGSVYQRYHNHASPAAVAASTAGAGALPGNSLVPFHLVSPPFAEKTGVAAVSLELAFMPPKDKQEDIVRLRIVDPVTRERDLVNTEFRLSFDLSRQGSQNFKLAFDLPDFVYNAGTRVWVWLVSKEGCDLNLAESKMTLHTMPVEQAAGPMVAQTLRLIAHTYSHSSEPHVWTRSFKWPGDEDHHYTWAEWPALPNLVRERLAPDNRIVGTYWNVVRPITNPSYAKWVDYSRSKALRELTQPRIEVPKTWPNPSGAPNWARYQNELLKSFTRIVHWWHDNRLVTDAGVLGGYGDDTQFTGEAFWVYFATGDAKLFRILEAVADGTWKHSGFRRGFPSRINDVGHDAEEVVGAWPLMIVADYGNPRHVERTMETMSLMDFFTTRTERGHLHFKSWYLGAS